MHFFSYSEIFPSLLTHAHRNQKHSNRSCGHTVCDHEHNWKDRKHSKRNGTEAFPNLGCFETILVKPMLWYSNQNESPSFQCSSVPSANKLCNKSAYQGGKKKTHKKNRSGKKKIWTPTTEFSLQHAQENRWRQTYSILSYEPPQITIYLLCVITTSRNVNTAEAKHSKINSTL